MAKSTVPNRNPDIIKRFQCTFLGGNNNKWWTIERWDEGIIRITYGRVGEACVRPFVYEGQKGSLREFENRIKDKTKPNNDPKELYTPIILHTPEVITKSQIQIDSKIVKRVERIFERANESIGKTLAGQVDALSQEQIEKGRNLLKLIQKAKREEKATLTEKYYNTIPTKLSRNIDVNIVVGNLVSALEEEQERLNQLSAALSGYQIMIEGGSILDQLGCEINFVSDDDLKRIQDIFKGKFSEAWCVTIPDERKRFQEETKGANNIRLLIHGTKDYYIRHILKQSFKLPVLSERLLFGAGIYHADNWLKSKTYIDGYENCYLLSEVKLGKMHYATKKLRITELDESLGDSVFGEAGKPIQEVLQGKLDYNEYIVYKPSQASINYLLIE